MVIVTTEPLDPAKTFENIDIGEAGSVVFHYAVVKADGGGKPTSHIDYRRAGDVEAELKSIAEDLRRERPLQDILLIRRLGTLAVGEIISLVAASSPASEDAFAACREGLARLKTMSSIVKNEVFSR